MDLYKQFDSDLAACTLCKSILQSYKVDPCASNEIVVPRPVVSGIRPKPLMVIGQTPGLTEYRTGKPFQGQAGQGIRGILAEVGISDFDTAVFSSAVVKCFPGRKHRKANDPNSKCEDRQPPSSMIKNCRPLLERQIMLANPSVIITLGGLALDAYLEISGQGKSSSLLSEFVGTSQDWNGRTIVFFPHTSGGSRWLNEASNKVLFAKAKRLLRSVLCDKGLVRA
jgi:uracil-DNA glycosylase